MCTLNPNATQWLQVDLLRRTANFTALPTTWHGALSQMNPTLNRFTFSQPPQQEFTKQQPKIFDRPRSQDNTPGRQFGLKLTTMTITITVRYFALICDAFQKISELSLDWAIWDTFLMQFRLFQKKWGSSLVENHQNMPGNGFLL